MRISFVEAGCPSNERHGLTKPPDTLDEAVIGACPGIAATDPGRRGRQGAVDVHREVDLWTLARQVLLTLGLAVPGMSITGFPHERIREFAECHARISD
jgi:hypothetical protein